MVKPVSEFLVGSEWSHVVNCFVTGDVDSLDPAGLRLQPVVGKVVFDEERWEVHLVGGRDFPHLESLEYEQFNKILDNAKEARSNDTLVIGRDIFRCLITNPQLADIMLFVNTSDVLGIFASIMKVKEIILCHYTTMIRDPQGNAVGAEYVAGDEMVLLEDRPIRLDVDAHRGVFSFTTERAKGMMFSDIIPKGFKLRYKTIVAPEDDCESLPQLPDDEAGTVDYADRSVERDSSDEFSRDSIPIGDPFPRREY